MRRALIAMLLLTGLLLLAGCGNKGPLVRPTTAPTSHAAVPKPGVPKPAVATKPAPAVAASMHAPAATNAPAYLSPPIPQGSGEHTH